HGLRKSYGELEAVRGIDLGVRRGEIFAFLGPNGAGKTTTVEILEGYRERSAGQASVLGTDPAEAGRDWRQRIGIVLQDSNLQPELTVQESLELYAGYYDNPRSVEETIRLVGLGARAHDRAGRLSGGQRRRLDVGLALVGDPELLFLDEPTTGFDPSARRQAWEVIGNLRDLGKTVFLTTHYMDEAQALADRVAIIAAGEIVAEGAPGELRGRQDAGVRISFRLPPGVAPGELPPEVGEALELGGGNGEVVLRAQHPVELLNRLTSWALERNLDLAGLEVRRPSLEDVYLELTEDQ
ncbi:MAG TPA: ABC transporter ATP-binding protein, partial [Solirubrobacterales bacterium]|nr:ABC transporter ATP-binding protein [Solirubrobacterales bacterium]